jgi:lipoprotein-releasing system ATP-binding protein
MSPFLEARDISKVFPRPGGDVHVLQQCGFALAEGEAVSVVGASGSGKSTLLNLLGGLDTPSSGDVFFRGRKLRYRDHGWMAEWRTTGVGFVFQFHFLLPDFTALENLLIPVRGRRRVHPDDRDRARSLLDLMGLSHRAGHLPGELSGGEQQRVAVARAFMNRPAIVLADEPFGNLDQDIGTRLGDLLFEIREREGTSLVIVTHDPVLARRTDRTLHLEDGHLVPWETSAKDG